jgi:catechol 2,3-dioxygenase-like lactoylglutathione lyase family enzyme
MISDMDVSIAFYEQLGFTLKQRWDNHYAMIIATGITIGLHPKDASGPVTNSGTVSIGLMIERADEAKALLDSHGIKYKAEDGGSGNYLHFKDPDGTVLYYVEPKWR